MAVSQVDTAEKDDHEFDPIYIGIAKGLAIIVGLFVFCRVAMMVSTGGGALCGVIITLAILYAFAFSGMYHRSVLIEKCLNVKREDALFILVLSMLLGIPYPFLGLPLVVASSLIFTFRRDLCDKID